MTNSIIPVYAIKIGSISEPEGGFSVITPAEGDNFSDKVTVTEAFVQKHSPKPGGYYILCEGGFGLYSE